MKNLIQALLILLILAPSADAGETISILTLNVAGLPDKLTKQDHPERRMLEIAQRAEGWDIVAYQEDFYYSYWLDHSKHFDVTVRGTKMHKWAYIWPWLRKSGLTIKTNLAAGNFEFTKFDKCFGHRRYANDCWVPKGVMCMRTLTPGGVLMDFCTIHMDAGSDDGSSAARRAQIAQYISVLPAPVHDVPWLRIETGDFNLRLYQEDIDPLMEGRDIVVWNNDTPTGCVDTCANDVDFITVTTNDHLNVRVLEG